MKRPITLIGFSGSGKSLLSQRLATELGFRHIDCDGLIERKLLTSLPHAGKSTMNLASWLGQPFDVGFSGRQQRYFFAEEEVVSEIVSGDLDTGKQSIVIDTTGSLIYLDQHLLELLRAHSTIVYLQVAAEDEQIMFERYFSDPKPVLWQDVFTINAGESPDAALRRCYPILLNDRAQRYAALADIVFPCRLSMLEKVNVNTLIDLVLEREHLSGTCS